MNSRKTRLAKGGTSPPSPLAKVASSIVGISLGVILVATLTPFNFTPSAWPQNGLVRHFFSHRGDIFDIVGNVLLFMPYGLGIAACVGKHWPSGRFLVAVALVASTTLSLTVETLQLILPSRTSSVIDIFTNSLGGLLGSVVYCRWWVKQAERSPTN